jgi:hypothetical protein
MGFGITRGLKVRVRKLSPTGDFQFGQGLANFWINAVEGVGQNIGTRLHLNQGDWFLDLTAGVPYATKVLGKFTGQTRDPVIQSTILGTQDVNSLISYSSSFNPNTRQWTVNAVVDTIFGQAIIDQALASI